MEDFSFTCKISELLFNVIFKEKLELEKDLGHTLSFSDFIEYILLDYFEITLMEMNNDMKFDETPNYGYYIYTFLDPRKPGTFSYGDYTFDYEPFYIGKGTSTRMFDHMRNEKNPLLSKKIDELKTENLNPIILKIVENLTNMTSYKIERYLIKNIGTLLKNTGPLCNIFDGGYKNIENKIGGHDYDKLVNNLIVTMLNDSDTIKDAANKIGISERTLYRKMSSLNIKKINGKYEFQKS